MRYIYIELPSKYKPKIICKFLFVNLGIKILFNYLTSKQKLLGLPQVVNCLPVTGKKDWLI